MQANIHIEANAMNPTNAIHISVRGTVQGVGFRPFVYSLALQHQLSGWVRNTSGGVEIEVQGDISNLDAFQQKLKSDLPPLARIDKIIIQNIDPGDHTSFEIISSQPEAGAFIPISPDVSICEDCQRELFDSSDRRYRYPFINCTNCGPRFTIIRDIPYDRPKTSMSGFEMCPTCRREYENPLDRRFHAQPIACPICGPHIWFETDGKNIGIEEEALLISRDWLQAGKILAVKGLGGFHLVCDAANPHAVNLLRQRKKRTDKPFALMSFDLQKIEKHCTLSSIEREMLTSRQRPVVILDQLPDSTLAPGVSLGQNTLGFMLPYTPLHLLLLEPAPGFPDVLVMTSGNISEEPIAYEDHDAKQRLTDLVDGFLIHDRPIHMRTDDSVIRAFEKRPYPIRRARGYAPDPIQLPQNVPDILATGAELKNTFCLTRDNYAFLSHFIGDMENYETLQSFESGIKHFEKLFRVNPEVLVCDYHPDYLASRYANQRADRQQIPLFQVQHHHAHLASCLADNGWDSDEPVIGFCFDGTGLGTDQAIWGGEVLLGDYQGYQRIFHLAYVPLPGGDIAIKKPARMALAHLWHSGIPWEPDLPSMEALCAEERTALLSQLKLMVNTPLTSSIGRLFDAASALIGVRQTVNYEGQAAIELESLADPDENGYYNFEITDGIFDPSPVWSAMLFDWRAGIPTSILAARFHNSIIEAVRAMSDEIKSHRNCGSITLSGGVWQNRYLLERTTSHLKKDGFKVLTHNQVPANDGGISLGQAMIAAHGHLTS